MSSWSNATTGPGLTRTFQRGLGTALGVVVGGLLLGALPIWATVGIICVVGAARQYLKAANYTAYALVMTPLVAVLARAWGTRFLRRSWASA